MDMSSYLRFLVALVFVLGLIALMTWLVRRFGPAGIALKATGRDRRVAIVEVTPIDARRRLVLVRRDGVEHLLLLGAGNDLLVESGFGPPAKPALQEPRP